MFCSKCGKEVADQAGFCPYCGAQVSPADRPPVSPEPHAGQVAAPPGPPASPGPPAPPGPPAGQPPLQPGPYTPPEKKSPLPWVLGGIGLVAVVAVVLVLVFVVFGGGSSADASAAEEVALSFLKSWENRDAEALVATFEPSFRAELEDTLGEYYDQFFEYFFEAVPDDLEITVRKMETKIDGDTAEVVFADGTMTYTDEDGEKVSDEASETDMSLVRLRKVDGKWYLDAAFLKEMGFDLEEMAELIDFMSSYGEWETVEDTYRVDIILPIDSEEEAFSALLEVPELSQWFWESFYSSYSVTDEGDAYILYLFEQPYTGDATPYGWFAVDKATGAVTRIPDR